MEASYSIWREYESEFDSICEQKAYERSNQALIILE